MATPFRVPTAARTNEIHGCLLASMTPVRRFRCSPPRSPPSLDLGPLDFTRRRAGRAADEWSWDEIHALPAARYDGDIHCVTTWSKLDTRFSRRVVDVLLAAARPLPPATHVAGLEPHRLHDQPAAGRRHRREGVGRVGARGAPLPRRARRPGPAAGAPPVLLEERQVGGRPARCSTTTSRASGSATATTTAATPGASSGTRATDAAAATCPRCRTCHAPDCTVPDGRDASPLPAAHGASGRSRRARDPAENRPDGHARLGCRPSPHVPASTSSSGSPHRTATPRPGPTASPRRPTDGSEIELRSTDSRAGRCRLPPRRARGRRRLEVRGPFGGWFVWNGDMPALLVGGGSGVVPLMSMLRHRRRAGLHAAAAGGVGPLARGPALRRRVRRGVHRSSTPAAPRQGRPGPAGRLCRR